MSCGTVAALETYLGLVEAGVGILPAGGGCKEIAVRAHLAAQYAAGGDVLPFVQKYFQTVAMATVSASALEANCKTPIGRCSFTNLLAG